LARAFRGALDLTGAGTNPDVVEALSIMFKPFVEGPSIKPGGISSEPTTARGTSRPSIAEALYPHPRAEPGAVTVITQERSRSYSTTILKLVGSPIALARGRAKAGERAGSPSGHVQGYRRLTVDYEESMNTKLLGFTFMVNGLMNRHEDTNGSNNAILNLRPVIDHRTILIPKDQLRVGLRGEYHVRLLYPSTPL